MKRIMVVLLLVLFVVACGGGDAPASERIVGTWSGMQTSASGDKVPATWTFLEDGTMLVEVMGVSYGAEWSVEGNRLNFTTELQPDKPNYRDLEFSSDEVVKMTKEGITETWNKVTE